MRLKSTRYPQSCLLAGSLYLICALIPSPLSAQAAKGQPRCRPATAEAAAPPQHCLLLIPSRAAGAARGIAKLTLANSPFGVTVTEDGRYIYDIRLEIRGLEVTPDVAYVVWAVTPTLDKRKKLGVVAEDLTSYGQVDWNRFMVVVTAETSPDVEEWAGPILFTAASPSGKMQTMAGEEIFWNNELPVGTRYCLVNDC